MIEGNRRATGGGTTLPPIFHHPITQDAMRTGSRGTILCIDDEASALRVRSLVLESAGYHVAQANTPEEALKAFRRQDFDLVITDHLLGRQTGTNLAAQMRRLKPSIRIIVLSGTTDLPDGVEHADEFISKTEGPHHLLSRVDAIMPKKNPGHEPPSDSASLPSDDSLQSLLASIVESSNDAILSKTTDGTITSWNKAAELMYGYTPREVIGKSVSILIPPDRKNELDDILARLRSGEKIDHYETVRVTKDGRTLNVSVTISPIRDASGRIVGASTIARNITEMKMAEQALRNSEKLAVAGRMAATVAHEINNPLEAVNNILYLIERSAKLDTATRELVQTAQTELRRVADITKLTLGFYRESSLRPVEVRVTDLIDAVLKLYGQRIASLGITVSKEYQCTGKIWAVSGELRQVFSNLIVNAVDALTDAGNRLTIRVRQARNWRTGEYGVLVVVADNGPGIPIESRGRLFQPFYTTKGEKGTGIGLWVSRSIVEKHGGSIRLRTGTHSERSGACFMVWLPASAGQRVSQHNAA